jgi:hypothetical protein
MTRKSDWLTGWLTMAGEWAQDMETVLNGCGVLKHKTHFIETVLLQHYITIIIHLVYCE